MSSLPKQIGTDKNIIPDGCPSLWVSAYVEAFDSLFRGGAYSCDTLMWYIADTRRYH